MKFISILFFLIHFGFTYVQGQTDTKVEKAIETFNSGKYDKGISMMEKIKDKNPSEDNWDLLVKMYSSRYEISNKNASDPAIIMLMQMGGLKQKDLYLNTTESYSEMISKSREALLYSQSPQASMILRIYLIDKEVDQNISSEARSEFNKAEEFFGKKEYENALLQYQKALEIQPDFYKATIYIGDCYWYLENMDSAIVYFQKGIQMHDDMLEPRKYLADALSYAKKDEEAKEACVEAICIYPDQSMFMKYEDLLERGGKKLNKHWIPRGSEVNQKGNAISKVKESHWTVYQEARQEVENYCTDTGIISVENDKTDAKYLEVYSWEKMLDSSSELPEEFSFAREMRDKGYLDCYVFISVFHFDLYGQFADFSRNNKDKIKTYIKTYLTE